MAERLEWMGLWRYGGRTILVELSPSTAFFASTSAASFPSLLMCPANHQKVILNLLLLPFFGSNLVYDCCQVLARLGHARIDCCQSCLVIYVQYAPDFVSFLCFDEVQSHEHAYQFCFIHHMLLCGSQV